MYCGHCGKQIPDNAEFCSYCGERMFVVNEGELCNSESEESTTNETLCFASDNKNKDTIRSKKRVIIGIVVSVVACLCILSVIFIPQIINTTGRGRWEPVIERAYTSKGEFIISYECDYDTKGHYKRIVSKWQAGIPASCEYENYENDMPEGIMGKRTYKYEPGITKSYSDEVSTHEFEYTYTNDGRIASETEKTTIKETGEVRSSITEYIYDNNTVKVQVKGSSLWRLFVYDNTGKRTESYFSNVDDSGETRNLYKNKYEYDNKGNLIRQQEYEWVLNVSEQLTDEEKKYYTENNCVVDEDGTIYKVGHEKKWTYDEKGNLATYTNPVTYFSGNNEKEEIVYERKYEYDDNGNAIRIKGYSNGNYVGYVEVEYNYFPDALKKEKSDVLHIFQSLAY